MNILLFTFLFAAINVGAIDLGEHLKGYLHLANKLHFPSFLARTQAELIDDDDDYVDYRASSIIRGLNQKEFDDHVASTCSFSSKSNTLEFQSFEHVRDIFFQCTRKWDPLHVFVDEMLTHDCSACRLAHAHYLTRAKVTNVADIEKTRFPGNGAMKIIFEKIQNETLAAQLKTCNHSLSNGREGHESWKAELVAHGIDRLMRIDRVPVTVPRADSFQDIKSAALSRSHHPDHIMYLLHNVLRKCNGGRRSSAAVAGSAMGWFTRELRLIRGFSDRFLTFKVFEPRKMTQSNLEFVRLLLQLYLFNHPHKLDHNILKIVNHTSLILVGIDNDRAEWTKLHEYGVFPNGSICSRAQHPKRFMCAFSRANPSTTELLAFFSQACIFPAKVAERISKFGSNSNWKLSDAVALHLLFSVRIAELHNLSVADDKKFFENELDLNKMQSIYNASVLDQLVFDLNTALNICLSKYRIDQVIFDDINDGWPRTPPRVHIDPAGRRYIFNPHLQHWQKAEDNVEFRDCFKGDE